MQVAAENDQRAGLVLVMRTAGARATAKSVILAQISPKVLLSSLICRVCATYF